MRRRRRRRRRLCGCNIVAKQVDPKACSHLYFTFQPCVVNSALHAYTNTVIHTHTHRNKHTGTHTYAPELSFLRAEA